MAFVQYDMGEVFSGKASGNMITGWDAPTPNTPQRKADYVLPSWAMDVIAWLRDTDREPLYIYGPTGCGKTSCIKQIASMLNMPVYECTGHAHMEFPELVGHQSVVNGSMQFMHGPLALAMRDGGMFVLNEIDLLDPSTAAGLNTILDGSPLMIPENGGEVIPPHPEFRFIATANSNGAGDDTGMYQGILRANLAFMDRFMLLEADYMPEDKEVKLLATKFPNLPSDIRQRMVQYANHIRKMFIGSVSPNDSSSSAVSNVQIPLTFSTRTLCRWAKYIVRYEPLKNRGVNVIKYTLDRAIAFRADRVSRLAMYELAQSIFGYQE